MTCTNGVEYSINGKPFLRNKQLKLVKNVRDLKVSRKPEPIPVEHE